MSTQHEITKPHKLLDENGYVAEPGYSKKMVLEYNRGDIRAKSYKIKEWDYYYVGNSRHAIAMTIADNSYMGLMSVTLFDFLAPKEITKTIMVPFTNGKLNLPSVSSKGVTAFKNKQLDMSFIVDGKTRRLRCDIKNFTKGQDLIADIVLSDEPKDSIVMATPFGDVKTAFYYNHKINCMKAKGSVSYNNTVYEFEPTDSMGSLDWGRGVWTYKNTWYWGSMSIFLEDGNTFGFNIGYGFGDTSAASENIVFYNGIGHKLSQVDFGIPTSGGKDDFMSPWHFTSDDGRFDMIFNPVIDRHAHTNIGIIETNQHQVFGKYSGKVILDDGKEIEITDKLGFAEKVYMKY